MVSAEPFEKGQAFLNLNTHSPIKNATREKSLEIFNGKYWDNLHITTTHSVRSGDILLIRAAGLVSCPGLREQIASMTPTQSANDASTSLGVSMSR
jgi:hypothetical protein